MTGERGGIAAVDGLECALEEHGPVVVAHLWGVMVPKDGLLLRRIVVLLLLGRALLLLLGLALLPVIIITVVAVAVAFAAAAAAAAAVAVCLRGAFSAAVCLLHHHCRHRSCCQ